ncbi:MAG: hypothetical protein HZB29_04040 [Nitrospinae bacterium]|nr:hypothetical protein [Nitrospinota bacterium]
MIGVLLTSTCWYEGIDKETFAARVEELVKCITTLRGHISQPYELIIADNSPAGKMPSEQILELCPPGAIMLRPASNPGKSVGEATLVRDGVHLSASRGHKWLLKLTGRYFIFGGWSLDSTIEMLEKRRKNLYVHLTGAPLNKIPWAKGHPLLEKEGQAEALLTHVATQVFIARPDYLVNSGALSNDFLYRENRWVNYEQLFWHAIRNLDFLHWPDPPVDGYEANKSTGITIQRRLALLRNNVYETTENYGQLAHVDISSLL